MQYGRYGKLHYNYPTLVLLPFLYYKSNNHMMVVFRKQFSDRSIFGLSVLPIFSEPDSIVLPFE